MKESKEETIKRLAYCIWQERCRFRDPNANNAEENYLRAKQVLYPEEMTLDEIQKI